MIKELNVITVFVNEQRGHKIFEQTFENCYFKMCFCDGYDFLIINKSSGEEHFIQGDETLCEFFEGYYSLPCLFHRLLKKKYVRLNDTLYHVQYNSHPECQRIKLELIKTLGIKDFE